MTDTYLAFYQGKRVGKRKSPRPYTHAIVVVDIPGLHEAMWMKPETDTKNNRDSFAYHVSIADGSYRLLRFVDEKSKLRSQLIASAGYERFLQDMTEQKRERYAAIQANLNMTPHVFGWSMSRRNAERMALQARTHGKQVLDIVPAEIYAGTVNLKTGVTTAG